MAIRRYIASADTTITNAFEPNLITRGTGSSMGASDISEAFTIYGQESSASTESMRFLTQFPIADVSADRTAGAIPASGSVNFYLRLYNARHGQTLPKNFNLIVSAVSRSWEEGTGLDMESYTDLTYNETGANWENASTGITWTSAGGDYYIDSSSSFTASFDDGTEDIELDVTPLVEQWVNSAGNVLGSKDNYGVIVKFPDAQEAEARSYYTKKFFARGTEFWYSRPLIEARWDSSIKDDTGNFYLSSSLATAAENCNTIYLYNSIRGQLRNIPAVGTDKILVSIYSGSSDNSAPTGNKYILPVGCDVIDVCAFQTDFSASVATSSTAPLDATYWLAGSNDLKVKYDNTGSTWAAVLSGSGYPLVTDARKIQTVNQYYGPLTVTYKYIAGMGVLGSDPLQPPYDPSGLNLDRPEYDISNPDTGIDTLWFQYTTDGESWSSAVEHRGWNDDPSLGGVSATGSWLSQTASISGVGPYYLRWAQGNFASTNADHWAIDDICIKEANVNIIGSYVSPGIYSASFAYTGSATTIFPVWHSASVEYHTASAITVKTFDSVDYNPSPGYVTAITNLKHVYSQDEEARFKLYVRQKNWNPNAYTTAHLVPENLIIEDGYYKIFRTIDELDVVEYGTGSLNHTRLSFDAAGNYFDLPIEILEKGYMYGIKLLYRLPNGFYKEQSQVFKFRVE